ncbi:MAG: hypothetical protein K8R54_16780 [Bacteroidales bacterium]|nr:hypothetical protein [Bacteroidales bacterium]
MKTLLTIFANIILISCFLISCNSDEGNVTENDTNLNKVIPDTASVISDSTQLNETNNKISVSKYICPQGDKEGNSDEPGICPVCEMELIENPDYISK